MDGFPAGVGQSCQLYLPSVHPSLYPLLPWTLLQGHCWRGIRGATLGD